MMQFLPIIAVGFLTAYGVTPVTRRFALQWNVVDNPNARKIHQEPIPLMGGVAIFFAFLLTTLLLTPPEFIIEFGAVLVGATWLATIGYIDDRQGMNPRTKLVAQVLAALIVMGAGIRVRLFDIALLDATISLFWIVGITNALNLMDNMDGLAAGITAVAAGFFFILAASQELILVASYAAALCGATLGFLRYNFNPATTFMGDTGSLVIGFLLAVLGIKLDFQSQVRFVTWIIPVLVLSIPILDTTLVTFTRLREGRSPFQGGKDHTSHRIANLGLSHRRTVVTMYLSAIVMGGLSIIISQAETTLAALLTVLAMGLMISAFIGLELSYERTKRHE